MKKIILILKLLLTSTFKRVKYNKEIDQPNKKGKQNAY